MGNGGRERGIGAQEMGREVAKVGQPGGSSGHWLSLENKLGSADSRGRVKTGNSPARQQDTTIWVAVTHSPDG
jgi:hypothetical protein